ncbi:MAG: Rrf2 family transcriptional regulator [Calditrichaeota bacterium]|nr:MAG: Rrf2 family transcriptional regulator [Calditrichota bacterium]
MLFSKACIYGIRATFYVSLYQGKREFIPINEISDALGISFHFLTKILQKLTRNSIMISYRGPKGGITLARAPEDISILEIIKAIDGEESLNSCILGLPGCGTERPCPLHDEWGPKRDALYQIFANTTLKNINEKFLIENFRISWKDNGGSTH